jgi:hypothetical protein
MSDLGGLFDICAMVTISKNLRNVQFPIIIFLSLGQWRFSGSSPNEKNSSNSNKIVVNHLSFMRNSAGFYDHGTKIGL